MTGTTPSATVCDVDGCAVLIPTDLENRREHRSGHEHDRKVEDALRRAVKDLRADLNEARAALDQFKTELRAEVSSLGAEISSIEIPEQIEPLQILTVDELEPLEPIDDDEPDDDEILHGPFTTATADVATELVNGTFIPFPHPDTQTGPVISA